MWRSWWAKHSGGDEVAFFDLCKNGKMEMKLLKFDRDG